MVYRYWRMRRSYRPIFVTYHLQKDWRSIWTRMFGIQIGRWFIGAIEGMPEGDKLK